MSDTNKKANIPGTSSFSLHKSNYKMSINKSDDKEALSLFPEEILELILNQISKSQDILYLLSAFPELDKIFHNKKPNILFQLVLPHIMTKHLVRKHKHGSEDYWYLQSKQIFDLRLVSKRWKYAVETSIQNQSDRHHLLLKSPNDNTLVKPYDIVPENHFSYLRMHKYHFGATVFQETSEVEKFIEEMQNFHGNPFPGKFVYCNILYPSDYKALPLFIPKIVEMLHKFGEFVNVLDLIVYDDDNGGLENFKTILKGLSCVPNLMSLTIRRFSEFSDYTKADEFFALPQSQQLFPELPKLKVFDWQFDSEQEFSWTNRMIDTYAIQNKELRKLSIDVYYCRDQPLGSLTNLTELHLYLTIDTEYTIASIRNILNLFPVGQLKKLCLGDLNETRKKEPYVIELLETISDFQIGAVVFELLFVKTLNTKEEFTNYAGNIASIKSLWLDDSPDLNLEFLKILSNLRFLHVYTAEDYLFDGIRNQLTSDLRSCFAMAGFNEENDFEQKMPESFSIWEEFPKLEMMSASVDYNCEILDVQFVRECGNKPLFGYRAPKEGEYGY